MASLVVVVVVDVAIYRAMSTSSGRFLTKCSVERSLKMATLFSPPAKVFDYIYMVRSVMFVSITLECNAIQCERRFVFRVVAVHR